MTACGSWRTRPRLTPFPPLSRPLRTFRLHLSLRLHLTRFLRLSLSLSLFRRHLSRP